MSRHWYALPLVYMMWEGGVNLANYQCRQLINDRFHRLDPILTKLVDIDEIHGMKLLKQTASEVDLRETLDWIDDHFDVQPEMEDLTAA